MRKPLWDSQRYATFLQTNCLLQQINDIPMGPKRPQGCLDITSTHHYLMSIKEEQTLTQAFAYLAAATDDPRKVVAVSIEELKQDSMRINLAVNHGRLDYDLLLQEIIDLSKIRILARLRSRHAKLKSQYRKHKLAQPKPLPQFHNSVRESLQQHQVLKDDPSDRLAELRHRSELMLASFNHLEGLQNTSVESPAMLRAIGEIIAQCFQSSRMLKSLSLKHTTLQSLTVVQKLARYQEIAWYLTHAGERLQCFRNITVLQVHLFPLQVKRTVLQASQAQSLSIVSQASVESKTKSQQKLSRNSLKSCRSSVSSSTFPVHAEVQLLIHHHLNNGGKPPRVIMSNKLPCVLCHILFRSHGQYLDVGTHGRFYEKWALPAVVTQLPKPFSSFVGEALDRVADYVEKTLQRSMLHGTSKIAPPLESVIGSIPSVSSHGNPSKATEQLDVSRETSDPSEVSRKSVETQLHDATCDEARSLLPSTSGLTSQESESELRTNKYLLMSAHLDNSTRAVRIRASKLRVTVEVDELFSKSMADEDEHSQMRPQQIRLDVYQSEVNETDASTSRPVQAVEHIPCHHEMLIHFSEDPWHGKMHLSHKGKLLSICFSPSGWKVASASIVNMSKNVEGHGQAETRKTGADRSDSAPPGTAGAASGSHHRDYVRLRKHLHPGGGGPSASRKLRDGSDPDTIENIQDDFYDLYRHWRAKSVERNALFSALARVRTTLHAVDNICVAPFGSIDIAREEFYEDKEEWQNRMNYWVTLTHLAILVDLKQFWRLDQYRHLLRKHRFGNGCAQDQELTKNDEEVVEDLNLEAEQGMRKLKITDRSLFFRTSRADARFPDDQVLEAKPAMIIVVSRSGQYQMQPEHLAQIKREYKSLRIPLGEVQTSMEGAAVRQTLNDLVILVREDLQKEVNVKALFDFSDPMEGIVDSMKHLFTTREQLSSPDLEPPGKGKA
ncbi:MAG: hypothetical protein Q9159_000888 [Coniocarpon cinnabarinum]